LDEWGYICNAFEQEYGVKPDAVGPQRFLELIDMYISAVHSLMVLVLENTKSEFSESAWISYGMDWGDEERSADFMAVRGSYDGNAVVRKLRDEQERIEKAAHALKEFGQRFV
jgi:hypothetical protein